MVVVGLPWYKIIRRTLELRVFSAGRYSMGMGLPDPAPMNPDETTASPGPRNKQVRLKRLSLPVWT
jgi:hypothetical protein